MKRRICVMLILCMVLSLFTGINVRRVKADGFSDANFAVDMYVNGTDTNCGDVCSSETTLQGIINAVSLAAIVSSPETLGVEVTIKLKSDIELTSGNITIPDIPKIIWRIESDGDARKKLTGTGACFYIPNGVNIYFVNIEVDYSGSNSVFCETTNDRSERGGINLSRCVINVTDGKAVSVNRSRVHIQDSIINSATRHTNSYVVDAGNNSAAAINDILIMNSTISASGVAIGVTLRENGSLTVLNSSIIAGNLAIKSIMTSGSSTIIKNNSYLSADAGDTFLTYGGSLTLEDSLIECSCSDQFVSAVTLNGTDGTISRCTISTTPIGVLVYGLNAGNSDKTLTINECSITATKYAIYTAMSSTGETKIIGSNILQNNIVQIGAENAAIRVTGTGKLTIDGSVVRTESDNANAISTGRIAVSDIELKNCEISARNGNTVNLEISRLKSDGQVELRCGDEQSVSTGYSCLSIGRNDESNIIGTGDARTGAIDVRSGKLMLIPYKEDNPASTSFGAIKINGADPISFSAITTANCEYVSDGGERQDPDALAAGNDESCGITNSAIYRKISVRAKEATQNSTAFIPSIDNIVEKKKEVDVSISPNNRTTDIVLDADAIKNLDLSNTNVLQIKIGKNTSSDSGMSKGKGVDLDMKLNVSALPDNIDSLKINTGANLIVIGDISNKLGTSLEIKLVEADDKIIQINDASKRQKAVSNVVDITCRVDGTDRESGMKVTLATRMPSLKVFSVQENGQTEEELSYSKIPGTFEKPVWVSIAEDGTVAKLESRTVANRESGEFILETEVSSSGTYGIMDEKDADEVIRDQITASGKSDKFIIRVKADKNKHTVTWLPVEAADTYKVYAAEGDGKYKKVARVSAADLLAFINKKTGKTEYKYKVAAYRQGRKIATSVVVYGVYDDVKQADSVIILKTTKKKLKVGGTYSLKPMVIDAAEESAVRYYSTNPLIAKVSKKGKITAVNPGVCEICAYLKDGSSKTIKITVK